MGRLVDVEVPHPLTRAQRIAVWSAAMIAALSRFAALSKGPWDWDEVLFCLAVDDFDVASHRPHPPGFPLHVLLGRIAHLFTTSEFTALQSVNVFAGMAVFPLMFWLARSLRFDFSSAFGAALVFAFLPNVWFYGGTAFSDVPAMVFYLAAVAAWLGTAGGGMYAAGAMLAAAALLIRPHGALTLIFPWASAIRDLTRARKFVVLLIGTSAAGLAVAAGYGIAVADTGFDKYVASFKAHAAYVAAYDSISTSTRPPLAEALRLLLDPYDAGKVSILINALALAGIAFGARRRVARILLTFGPQFLFVIVAMHPYGSSRFSLAYMAGIILLATEGTAVAGRLLPRYGLVIRAAILAVIAGRLVTWVLPAFDTPRRSDPPAVAAAKWVRQNTPPDTPIVFDHGILPWVRYYLPDRDTMTASDWEAGATHPRLRHAWFLAHSASEVAGAVSFTRPRNRTWNIVTRRGFEASAVPLERVARFETGWYPLEADGSSSWRWAQRRSTMLLAPMEGPREISLELYVPLDALSQPVTLQFRLNSRLVHTHEARKPDEPVRFRVATDPHRTNVLEVEASDAFVPKERGGRDERALAWMLRSWACRPLPPSRGRG